MIDKSTEMNHCIRQVQNILHIIRPKKKWYIYYDKMNSENICQYTEWQRQYHGIRTGDEYIFIREDDENCDFPLLYVVNVSAESTLFAMSNLMKLLADKF